DAPAEEAIPELPAEDPAESEEVVGLPWLEPIDRAVVVDNNAELPEGGLAVRVSATVDGEILGRVPVGSSLDVTEQRIWDGEQSFVRVNFNGQGGYVNGNFVVLDSEQVAEEPVVEEPVVEESVVEEPAVEEPAVTEEPVVEEPNEDPAEDAAAATAEPAAEHAPAEAPPA